MSADHASAQMHPVPEDIASSAHIKADDYTRLYEQSVRDPEGFWGEQGKSLDWMTPYSSVKNTTYELSLIHI